MFPVFIANLLILVNVVLIGAILIDLPPACVTCGAQVEVGGFPTLYFFAGKSKDSPVQYQGARETEDLAKFIMDNVRITNCCVLLSTPCVAMYSTPRSHYVGINLHRSLLQRCIFLKCRIFFWKSYSGYRCFKVLFFFVAGSFFWKNDSS